MTFAVEYTDVADMEVQDIFLWILGRSPDTAARWLRGLERSVDSLSEFPERCRIAPESDVFDAEIRQHLYGGYRILFRLIDVDGDGTDDTVRVLHVRHAARRPLTEEDRNEDG